LLRRLVQELTDEYEYKLQEEQLALQRVKDDKDKLMAELEETRRQVPIWPSPRDPQSRSGPHPVTHSPDLALTP
jgi:hypothetical protein